MISRTAKNPHQVSEGNTSRTNYGSFAEDVKSDKEDERESESESQSTYYLFSSDLKLYDDTDQSIRNLIFLFVEDPNSSLPVRYFMFYV
jgi:hypothetical protein